MHFVRDELNCKLKGGILFTIYLQTLGDFSETIHCTLAKTCRIFAIFTESFYKNMGIILKKFTCLLKNHMLVYVTVICLRR